MSLIHKNKNIMIKWYVIFNSIFIFYCYYSNCFALEDDHLKTVHIVADSGIYNYKTGVNIYEGHVKVDQGSTHLLADRLITKNNNKHMIQVATAYGITSLAHYWTLPKPNDKEMHAYAKVIKFYPIESNVTLEREAFVKQGNNSFQGELIHYNSKEQTIIVPALQKSHAVLVYNPEK